MFPYLVIPREPKRASSRLSSTDSSIRASKIFDKKAETAPKSTAAAKRTEDVDAILPVKPAVEAQSKGKGKACGD